MPSEALRRSRALARLSNSFAHDAGASYLVALTSHGVARHAASEALKSGN